MKVISKEYGEGNLYKIKKGVAEIQFSDEKRKICFPIPFVTGSYETDDPKLLKMINDEMHEPDSVNYLEKISRKTNRTTSSKSKSYSYNSLNFETEKDFYNTIGYLASSDNVYLSAEVPNTEKEDEFKSEFPNQPYSIINVTYDEAGMVSKHSSQFRIRFKNLDDVPECLLKHVTNDKCINRTAFVKELVTNYGFNFGRDQDIEQIKSMIQNPVYLSYFEDGMVDDKEFEEDYELEI